MIEKKFNEYGQEQKIKSLDKLIKIGDKYLQVRLISTEKWQGNGFIHDMPRARFVNPAEDDKISYIVDKEQVIKWKSEGFVNE